MVAAVGAQDPPQKEQQEQPTTPEVTLTGCLIHGSQPSVFILDNAKPAAGTMTEIALRYLLIAEGKDVRLLPHVNHHVEIRGSVSGSVPPPEKQREEADLPTLRAQALTMLSSTCAEYSK
jgi:hypothetical protein